MSFWSDPVGSTSDTVSHAGTALSDGVQQAGRDILGDKVAGNLSSVTQGLTAPVADKNWKWDWEHLRNYGELGTGLGVSGGSAALLGKEATQQIGGAAALGGAAIYGAGALGAYGGGAGAGTGAADLSTQQGIMLAVQDGTITQQEAMIAMQNVGVGGAAGGVAGAVNAAAPAAAAGGTNWALPAVAGAGLLASKLGGQKQVATSASGAAAGAEGQKLLDQYNKGELNPADQYNINQWQNQNIQSVRDLAARSGTSDSTMTNQQIGQIQQQAEAMKGQALNSMLQTGLNALNIGVGAETAAIQAQIAQDTAIQNAQSQFFQTMMMWGAR